MRRFVLSGVVAVVAVGILAYFAAFLAALPVCLGDGDPYAVDSQALRYCNGDLPAVFWAEIAVPVVCMIAFAAWAVVSQRSIVLWVGTAIAAAIILGLAFIPSNLNPRCSQEQVERGDNCGY
jgi:hypothetical protein